MAKVGLNKDKVYKIEDSNIALLSSDLNHKVRAAAAQTEKAWDGVGKNVGLWVWRIEKFQVRAVPKAQVGHFYEGDSYIILKTYQEKPSSPKLAHDIHFWLGKFTTQDEAGTAAYKTVELDDFLGGVAHQHRECMGYESEQMIGYFGGHLHILAGGIESGFHHVEPEKYVPRLLHLRQTLKKKHVRLTQVELNRNELCEGDVFILDVGLKLYQFNAAHAGIMAKRQAGEICHSLKQERHSRPQLITVEQNEKSSDAKEFWDFLGGVGPIKSAEEGRKWEKDHHEFHGAPKRLLQVSDETGKMEMKVVAEGTRNIKRSLLNSRDIMILDSGSDIFVWVGTKSNHEEKKAALGFAQTYLSQYKRPAHIPIHKIFEHGVNEAFDTEIQPN